jgi:hypothetical protein
MNLLLPAQLRVLLAHELHERAVDAEITSILMVVKERQVLPSVSTRLAAENTRSQKLSSAASAPIWPTDRAAGHERDQTKRDKAAWCIHDGLDNFKLCVPIGCSHQVHRMRLRETSYNIDTSVS